VGPRQAPQENPIFWVPRSTFWNEARGHADRHTHRKIFRRVPLQPNCPAGYIWSSLSRVQESVGRSASRGHAGLQRRRCARARPSAGVELADGVIQAAQGRRARSARAHRGPRPSRTTREETTPTEMKGGNNTHVGVVSSDSVFAAGTKLRFLFFQVLRDSEYYSEWYSFLFFQVLRDSEYYSEWYSRVFSRVPKTTTLRQLTHLEQNLVHISLSTCADGYRRVSKLSRVKAGRRAAGPHGKTPSDLLATRAVGVARAKAAQAGYPHPGRPKPRRRFGRPAPFVGRRQSAVRARGSGGGAGGPRTPVMRGKNCVR